MQLAVPVAAAAATSLIERQRNMSRFIIRQTGFGPRTGVLAAVLLITNCAQAAVLPEDRADLLFHSYSGDNVTIQGPSLLVRKEFAGKFSASANYYVDRVSSASIDVVTRASEYTEERTQHSVGLDYLHDRWIMTLGFRAQ